MTLTQPQREALDALFPASTTPVQGWFKTWFGLDASMCASVGYADIFAVTQAGKAIAALVMIVGPALAARSLDRPKGG